MLSARSVCALRRKTCRRRACARGHTHTPTHTHSTTAAIKKFARAQWSEIQRYRYLTFAGHLARLDPGSHLAATVLHWRSDRWWNEYRETLPAKTGGQSGRRAANVSVPGAAELAQRTAFEAARREAPHFLHRAVATLGCRPLDWRHLAQDRVGWRELSRWASFRRSAQGPQRELRGE